METTRIGNSTLRTSRIGLGCMGMSEFYGSSNRQDSISLIPRAIDIGVTFLDTADMYGRGANEELVGEAIRDRREQVVLATKFGVVRDSDAASRGVNGHPDYVKAACEASLKRLNIDAIDLYYQHCVDPFIPIEETVGTMAELISESKVRAIGLSEAAPDTVRKAHTTHPAGALQTEYSLC